MRNAGPQGTDDEERQLDQREFEETKRSLRWLATCQIGRYRNRRARYRAELLDILGDFTNHGLPAKHGIELNVLPTSPVVRGYHSVALLMPDGAVWVAGSNFDGGPGIGNRELRIEIFVLAGFSVGR